MPQMLKLLDALCHSSGTISCHLEILKKEKERKEPANVIRALRSPHDLSFVPKATPQAHIQGGGGGEG